MLLSCALLSSEWNIKSGSQHIHLIVIYRPPYTDNHPVMTSVFLTEFAEFLESVILSTDPLLITGDFNIHVDNLDTIKLLELFQSTGLERHVNVPTHVGGHSLDLIVTRQSERIISSAPHADTFSLITR